MDIASRPVMNGAGGKVARSAPLKQFREIQECLSSISLSSKAAEHEYTALFISGR